MTQSLSVFWVMWSTDEPHALPSVAMTVTSPLLSPVPLRVIITPLSEVPPLVNDCGASVACVGSDKLQVAVLPSSVTAGIWNTCAVLPGMYAEYMGAKTTLSVGFAQAPAAPSPPPLPLPLPPLLLPEVLPSGLSLELLPLLPEEQAVATMPAPTEATRKARRRPLSRVLRAR